MLDKILQDEQDARKDRIRSGKFSPSSFGGCLRKQYWNRKDEPKTNDVDARTLRVFRVGTMFHEFIQNLMKTDDTELEVKIETDDVCGYADMVTPDEVIELKSQHSRAFWYMAKSNKSIFDQKPDHVMQVCYYALQLGRKWARLVYISKDDLCIEEYKIELTDALITKVEGELDDLNKYWVKDELPPAKQRLYKQKDGTYKECGYCAWKDKCKQMEKGTK